MRNEYVPFRLRAKKEKKELLAYECPVCGKKMPRSSETSFVCASGHLRYQHELTGLPWLDTEGIWHNLNLGG